MEAVKAISETKTIAAMVNKLIYEVCVYRYATKYQEKGSCENQRLDSVIALLDKNVDQVKMAISEKNTSEFIVQLCDIINIAGIAATKLDDVK